MPGGAAVQRKSKTTACTGAALTCTPRASCMPGRPPHSQRLHAPLLRARQPGPHANGQVAAPATDAVSGGKRRPVFNGVPELQQEGDCTRNGRAVDGQPGGCTQRRTCDGGTHRRCARQRRWECEQRERAGGESQCREGRCAAPQHWGKHARWHITAVEGRRAGWGGRPSAAQPPRAPWPQPRRAAGAAGVHNPLRDSLSSVWPVASCPMHSPRMARVATTAAASLARAMRPAGVAGPALSRSACASNNNQGVRRGVMAGVKTDRSLMASLRKLVHP